MIQNKILGTFYIPDENFEQPGMEESLCNLTQSVYEMPAGIRLKGERQRSLRASLLLHRMFSPV